MIHITKSAQEHFVKLLSSQEEGTQIRVFVINPGTPKAECGVSYCSQDAVEATDTRLQYAKLSVFVDAQSAPYLDNAEIDLISDELGSELTLRAPNAKMRRVYNNLPLIERIKYFLLSEINPQLAGHNGYVTLVEITDDHHVILQFGGGCNGCSMIDVTLKGGIEKELLLRFPELKGVCDITDHHHGMHSYY